MINDRQKAEISISLDKEVIVRIDEHAKAYGLSRSSVMNMFLREVLGIVPNGFNNKKDK